MDVEAGQPRKKARVLPSDGPEVVPASVDGVVAPAARAAAAPAVEGVVAPVDHASPPSASFFVFRSGERTSLTWHGRWALFRAARPLTR